MLPIPSTKPWKTATMNSSGEETEAEGRDVLSRAIPRKGAAGGLSTHGALRQTARTRSAARPKTSAMAVPTLSSEFLWHSILLLLGRVGNRIIEFYNGLFTLGNRDTARIYENLGHGFRKRGQYDKALTAYRELVKLNPNSASSHFHMGRIYEMRGESDLAVKAYQKVIEIKPNHTEALYRLGLVLGKADDLEGAIEILGRAAEQNPASHRILYRLGILHDKSGSPEKALVHLERAVELKDDEPRYHQYLGFVYEGLGRHDEAVRHFKVVMEMEGALEDET